MPARVVVSPTQRASGCGNVHNRLTGVLHMPESSPSTILYVDDTEAQRYAISRVLRRSGFEVLEASTGRQALDTLSASPDLIVLDVNLPDINGIELCKRIKINEATAHVPVLQVSATLIDTRDRVAGLEGGADAYLVQPIDPDELIATIRSLLRIRKAEDDARRRASEIETIYASAPIGLAMLDPDLRFVRINQQLAQINGLSAAEHVGHTLQELFPEIEKAVGHLYRQVVSTGEPMVNVETRAAAPTHPEVMKDWLISLHPLKDDRGKVMSVNAVIQDITDRKRTEELTIKEQTQRQLFEREILARENERERLARELHDESGQMLTSLLAGLRLIEESKTVSKAKKQARVLRELASRTISEVGRLSRDLHPIVLDDLGLAAAVRHYAAQYSELHGLTAEVDIVGLDSERLPQAMERGLYRIAQEALTNVARHAQAKHVAVHLTFDQNQFTMTIRDDGRGFVPYSHENGGRRHLGLQSMRERASIMGGTFSVDSSPGQGTCVTVAVATPRKHSASTVLASAALPAHH